MAKKNKTEILFKRKSTSRPLRKSYMIYCEGEVEQGYFNSFKKRAKTLSGGNAFAIVKQAIAHRSAMRQKVDEYWIVFDKDDTENEVFNNAIALASESGFGVAYSNQAFELWFLLHFELVCGALGRNGYSDRLNPHLSFEYSTRNKSATTGERMFKTLFDLMDTAISNATNCYNNKPAPRNPANEESSTTVFKLVSHLKSEFI